MWETTWNEFDEAARTEQAVTVKEAGALFPKPLHERSVLRRIKAGIDGVRLVAMFDGYRYRIKPSHVRRFLFDVTEKRKALAEHLSETVRTREEQAAAAIERIKRL